MQANQPKIAIKNLCKHYENRQILKNISFNLNQSEILSIIGRSGSGKSTIFNCISGLCEYEGEIELASSVAYMQQKDLLLPHLSILDNIALPLVINGVSRSKARARASELFDTFGLLGCEELYPFELSGGMRQRSALARTHILGQDILLLDEPFSALDDFTKASLHKWYLQIHHKLGLSSIFITHSLDEAVFLSNRVFVLENGLLKAEFVVDLSYPRNPDSQEFFCARKSLSQLLEA